MWAGAGIGVAASLPVYLFYLGDDAPPARRGLIFTGTAMLLGLGVGGVLGYEGKLFSTGPSVEQNASAADWVRLDSVAPLLLPNGLGVSLNGSLF